MCRILVIAVVPLFLSLLLCGVMAIGNGAAAVCEWRGIATPKDRPGRPVRR